MKTALVPVAATAAVLFAAIVVFAGPAAAQTAPAGAMTVEKVARGKYLVATSACMDCHTPFKMGPKGPEPDMSRMLSGHPQDLKMPPAPALPPVEDDLVRIGCRERREGESRILTASAADLAPFLALPR